MKNALFCIALILLSGCATQEGDLANPPEAAAKVDTEVPMAKRVYYLQHKLISKWLFESEGAFFFDVSNGNVDQLTAAATNIVNAEYANSIAITKIPEHDAVLISFPEPKALANCYFVLLKKGETGFSYYTYEKTMNFGAGDFIGVVGGWDKEGGHSNYGPRDYSSEEAFINDVLELE